MNDVARHEMSRRGVLRIGGLSVAISALVAACGNNLDKDAHPARVGDAPPPPKLPDGIVTDGVLFRTATSIHYSIVNAHNLAKKLGKLIPAQTAIVDNYIAAHKASIIDLQKWTATAGSMVWTCANPRFDRVILKTIEGRITGRPKQGTEEVDVAPSDDANRDAMALVYSGESLISAMHQALVPQYSVPGYRAAGLVHGQAAARRAAALAVVINPGNLVNPGNLLNANLDLPPTTTIAATTSTQNIGQTADNVTTTAATGAGSGSIQQYYAIASQFGTLSAVQLALGAFSSGTQFTINIETPSLNSFVYDYETCF